jgi:sterol 14-demethylase
VSRLAPELPGGLPWLGHALAFRRDPVTLLRRGRERLGDVFAIRLAGTRATVFTGPAAQGAVFQAPEEQLSARAAYRFTVPIFGKGVAYDATPQGMDEQMGLLYPALRDDRLRAYARVMQAEAETYCAGWGEQGEVDLVVAMNDLTVFIASRCLVGDEFRHALSREFAHLYHDLEGGINLVAFFNPNLPLPAFRRRDRARRRTVELVSRIIARRRAGGLAGEDFLQTLMTARDSDGRALDDDLIAGLLLTIVFAGQHTSAVLAAWTGVLLLEHPAYLGRVLTEQAAVFGDGFEASLERLRRLEVLERALKEAERLYPPLPVLMRRVERDFEHDGVVAPAGGLVLVSPAVSHRIPDVFADPDRFDPDRFGPGRQEDRKHRHALIGFGGGHHRCIGSTFAYQQVKVLWSVLLREFDLEPVTRRPRPDYSTFVPGPAAPCRVRYRRKRPPAGRGGRAPAAAGDRA